MATSTANLVHDNSSLANFQSWAQFIFDAFNTTGGWTQTTDTGQTQPSAAGSVGTYYFLFKMADALQASFPVFVKITYGTSGTAVRFTVQVGTGSDGSGNLTGATTNISLNGTTTNGGATAYPCYASGDSGSIRMIMWQGNSSYSFVFGVERSKDSTGANTAGYVTLISGDASIANSGNNQPWNFQHILPGALVSPEYSNATGWFTAALSGVSLNFNGTTAAAPFIPYIGFPDNPLLDWCCASNLDVGDGITTIVISIYGSNHNYVSAKTGALGRVATNNSRGAILMRYE